MLSLYFLHKPTTLLECCRRGKILWILTFDSVLVRSDGGALDADVELLDGIGAVDGDLVVSLVPVLDAQVVRVQLNVQEWEDQLVLDQVPDDPAQKQTNSRDHQILIQLWKFGRSFKIKKCLQHFGGKYSNLKKIGFLFLI